LRRSEGRCVSAASSAKNHYIKIVFGHEKTPIYYLLGEQLQVY